LVIDSGATCYITPDLRIFISYKLLAVKRLIYIINRSIIKGVIKGTVVLYICTDRKVKKVRLIKVLYISEIYINLILIL
jgi:hypothetical protein